MSSEATYLLIRSTPDEKGRESVSSEPAAQTQPLFRSKMNLEQAEPTIDLSKAQLLEQVNDGSEESPKELSDEFLFAEAVNGRKEAIGLLFRRYRRVVWSVARRILRDETEAEDLCQEVFLLLFQKAKLFDASKGTASSWIVQIAYHRAMNRKRYLERRQHYDVEALDEELVGVERRHLIVDDIAAKALLNRLRGDLSADQRVTMELHFFDGYSLREIAEKTNQSLGNVRHHYYRGLEQLRSMIFPKRDA
jgi:RNA polymerase sigma-70 factor (ECF subfamily)